MCVCVYVWSWVSLGFYSSLGASYHLDHVTNQRGPAAEAFISVVLICAPTTFTLTGKDFKLHT